MLKFIGWLAVLFVLFCIFGFVSDWIDVTKHNESGRAEYTFGVNHLKIRTDLDDCFQAVRKVGQ